MYQLQENQFSMLCLNSHFKSFQNKHVRIDAVKKSAKK